jgi:ElaA protein
METAIKKFSELTLAQLYEVLRLRAQVFVLEQNCPYVDPDNLDFVAFHLLGYNHAELSAYARILPPGTHYKEASIGRVVSAPNHRQQGLGKQIFAQSVAECTKQFPNHNIRIMAQSYLLEFYSGFGFHAVSQEFLEDGIPHVEMLLTIA